MAERPVALASKAVTSAQPESSRYSARSGPCARARLSLIRCIDKDLCSTPEPLSGSRIHAPSIGTREAKLLWTERPGVFLLVKKWHDESARDGAIVVGDWLVTTYGVQVVTLPDDTDEYRMPSRFQRFVPNAVSDAPTPVPVASAFVADAKEDAVAPDDNSSDVDLVITIGGDGTVLHLSSIFQHAMPPVVALAFGSLGFTTSHSFETFKDLMARVLGPPAVPPTDKSTSATAPEQHYADPASFCSEPVPVSIRMRLRVDVFRAGSDPALHAPEASVVVLNELLLERGPSPYMASLDAYIDDVHLTTVLADGLIIATQTGSTAYSLSAGGSILSPNTAAIAFTPICPHTLSFRPLLLPDSAVIRLEVPRGARSSAWCSFDGRGSRELRVGDFVVVRSSPWPMPLLCRETSCGDWVRSLKAKLLWNVREVQKGFDGGGGEGGGGGLAPGARSVSGGGRRF